MTQIFVHAKRLAASTSIHSFIRDYYVGRDAGREGVNPVGYDDGNAYWILSNVPPLEKQGLIEVHPIPLYLAEKDNKVVVNCVVSFDNRGSKLDDNRKKAFEGVGLKGSYKVARDLRQCPGEVIKKFCQLTGLRTVESRDWKQKPNVASVPPLRIKTAQGVAVYNVNRFEIRGTFEVDDCEAFVSALQRGVGSRKSHGNGLIFARPFFAEIDLENGEQDMPSKIVQNSGGFLN
jgi:hypothetical protein